MKKVVLKISGMHCVSCALNIDGELEDLPGVIESTTNYAKQITQVTFDPEKLPLTKILESIKHVGYEASPQ